MASLFDGAPLANGAGYTMFIEIVNIRGALVEDPRFRAVIAPGDRNQLVDCRTTHRSCVIVAGESHPGISLSLIHKCSNPNCHYSERTYNPPWWWYNTMRIIVFKNITIGLFNTTRGAWWGSEAKETWLTMEQTSLCPPRLADSCADWMSCHLSCAVWMSCHLSKLVFRYRTYR